MRLALALLTLIFMACPGMHAYSFSTLEERHGLSGNYVHDVKRDCSGYIWIATQSGIDRYDGYRVKHIPAVGAFTDNPTRIEIDAHSNIWVMTRDSLYFRGRNGLITNVDKSNELPTPALRKAYGVVASNNGNAKGLWILRRDSLLFHDLAKGTTVGSRIQFQALDAAANRDGIILLSPEGNLYISFRNDRQLRKIGNSSTGNTRINVIGDTCWIFDGYKPGVSFIPLKDKSRTAKRIDDLEGILIKDIVSDSAGNIWFATNDNGILIYSHNGEFLHSIKHNNDPFSLSSNHLTRLFIDDNLILAGTSKRGLDITSATAPAFKSVSTGIDSDISFLHQNRNGLLIIGYDGDGMAVYPKPGATTPVRHLTTRNSSLPSDLVIGICAGDRGNVFGSYGGGLFSLADDWSITPMKTSDSIQYCRNIISYKGDIWAGTFFNGLFKVGGRHYSTDNSPLQSNCITGLAMNGRTIFVATSAGLSLLDTATGRMERSNLLPANTAITTIYADRHGLLWLGTNYGIYIIDHKKKTAEHISSSNGLPSNVIRGITEDPSGNIWITGANSISRIRRSVSAKGEYEFNIRSFSAMDGIGDMSFNRYAITCTNSGQILAGSLGRYIMIDPGHVSDVQPAYRVYVTDVYINGINIGIGEKAKGGRVAMDSDVMDSRRIDIDYYNNLQLALSSLTISDAKNVQYEYSLDGNDWISNPSATLILGELPSGRHKLSLRVAGHQDITDIDLYVHPPFYRSTAAYIFYALLLIMAVYFIYLRIRKSHLKELGQQHTDNVLDRSENTAIKPDDKFITDAKDFIEKNLEREDFGVEELSSAMGMSRSNLYKKMTAVTGQTPLEFIRRIRMREGRKLLDSGQTSISQIAYSIGMSPKQFSKYFKEETGLTPTQYLKQK